MNRKTVEYIDALDCTGAKTGRRITRDQAHCRGTWHGAFHCLIIYERQGKGYAVFQKRSASKKIAPGRFDVSVGGHYSSGEDARDAGPREVTEEIGLPVKFEELVGLGRRVFVHCFTPGIREYEFQDVFLLPRAIQPEEIRLQAEEVDGLFEMEVASGIRLFSGEIQSLTGNFRTSNCKSRQHAVTANEFVPCLDNYYLKLLILVKRYFEGERLLVI